MSFMLVYFLMYSALAHAGAQCKLAVANAKCEVACQSKGYSGGKVAGKMCECHDLKALAELLDQTITLPRAYLQRVKEDEEY